MTESTQQTVDLARRLRAAGAKFYGAFWCSHCFEQKEAFGAAAAKELPYVECYPDGFFKVRSQEDISILIGDGKGFFK